LRVSGIGVLVSGCGVTMNLAWFFTTVPAKAREFGVEISRPLVKSYCPVIDVPGDTARSPPMMYDFGPANVTVARAWIA